MTEGEKCGLSSILPMSCRGRAEAFARRLHTRLRTLGSQDDNGSADESSWLAANENPIAISQPRHASDSDMCFEFGLLESPGSPEEELEENELHKLINRDTLKHSHSDECHCPKANKAKKNNRFLSVIKSNSNDSDSDGPFYDTENFSEERIRNGDLTSESSRSLDNETGIDINSEDFSTNQEESFATTSDTTPMVSASISEDVSTLSLKDEDYPSLEVNGLENNEPVTEISKCTHDNSDNEYAKCDGDVTPPKNDTETYIGHLNVDKNLTVECSDTQNFTAEVLIDQTNGDNNNDNTDDDIETEERTPRVRRCSSLKTGKTPPGTPGRKKIVRFADVLGLDLADVRTFLDEIPKVPISAYEDLSVDLSESSSDTNLINEMNKFHGIKVDKILMPLFQQPGGQTNFLDIVRDNQVCLENAVVDDPLSLSIKGTVRVRNLDFHKSVHIRYSLNSWKSFADVQALYVDNSCDGFSDKFSFLLYAHTLSVGQRLEFACRFQSRGCQYWDNNNGANYCFQCLPATNNTQVAPLTHHVDDWGASFY